mgnify:CR=1 FL=1
MFGQLLTKIVGTQNDRELKRLRPRVADINAFEPAIKALNQRVAAKQGGATEVSRKKEKKRRK